MGVSSGKKYNNNKNHLRTHTTIPHLLSLDRTPAAAVDGPGGVDDDDDGGGDPGACVYILDTQKVTEKKKLAVKGGCWCHWL